MDVDTNVEVDIKVKVKVNVDINIDIDVDIDVDVNVDIKVNVDTNIEVDVNRVKISTLVDTVRKPLYYKIQMVSKSRIKQKATKRGNYNDLWLCTSKYQPTRIRNSN